jgi:hypothetical protein
LSEIVAYETAFAADLTAAANPAIYFPFDSWQLKNSGKSGRTELT